MLAKAQNFDLDHNDYVLIEELGERQSPDIPSSSSPKFSYRIVETDANIWKLQTRWGNRDGRFVLERKNRLRLSEKVDSLKKLYRYQETKLWKLRNGVHD